MGEAPDRLLAGKYRLVRQLGRGGMGSVWVAEHLALHSKVAVKLIDEAIAENEEMQARFIREARASAALRSPHVVQILDHGVDGRRPYIVMELLEGESLAARLDRLGTLTPTKTAEIVTHVGRAVARAHDAGVIHRDLKPENVFLVRNDDEEIAKVLDFGIAKTLHSESLTGASTHTGVMLGTPFYMSPEQAVGSKLVDRTTDFWAIGVIAFECLLGRRPFHGETLGELVLAVCSKPMPLPSAVGPVPSGFDAWFARACSREPQYRFGSAKECVAMLREVCGAPQSLRPEEERAGTAPTHRVQVSGHDRLLETTGQVAAASRPAVPQRGSRAPWAMGAVAALASLGGIAVWWTSRSSELTLAEPTVAEVGEPSRPVPLVVPQVEAPSLDADETPRAPPSVSATTTAPPVTPDLGPEPGSAKVPAAKRRPRVTPAPIPIEAPLPEAPRPEAPTSAPPKVNLGI